VFVVLVYGMRVDLVSFAPLQTPGVFDPVVGA
jgi:hypothetical protein